MYALAATAPMWIFVSFVIAVELPRLMVETVFTR